jgi:methanogenic corrinoid protein MtbC1
VPTLGASSKEGLVDRSSSSQAQVTAAVAEGYRAALLAGDPQAAERMIREAIDAGLGQATIDDRVIAPAMHHVGDLWQRGVIGVAEEHLATSISMRVMALQREAFRVARSRRGQMVMLAAIEDEHHVLGLEMAAGLLHEAGFDVRLLGADVPVASLQQIVERHRPAVVGLTATMASAHQLLPASIEAVGVSAPGSSLVVGGTGVPESLRETDALVRVDHVGDVVEVVDALVRRPSLN